MVSTVHPPLIDSLLFFKTCPRDTHEETIRDVFMIMVRVESSIDV